MNIISKYKPKSFDDLILPQSTVDLFKEGLNNNYLFVSGPGTGKTSTAFVISKTFGYETLYKNASADSSVESLKNEIIPFCESSPLVSATDKKLVILDEVDGVSLQYKKALRGVLNDFSDKAYFIMTCNSMKGDDFFRAILSRSLKVDFSFPDLNKKEKIKYQLDIIRRYTYICEEEGVSISEKVAWSLIKPYFPDFRRSLQVLSSLIDRGIKEINADTLSKTTIEDSGEILDLVLGAINPMQIHKVIYNDYRNKVEDTFELLHTELFEHINNSKPEYLKYMKQLAICIANWDAKKDSLVLPVHALKACIFELQTILNYK